MDWLSTWRKDGIAIGPATDLIATDLVAELQDEARRVMADRFLRMQAIQESRGHAKAKKFLRQWLGRFPIYDATSVWARMATVLQPLAAEYLPSPPILRFYNLWEIVPSSDPPSRSQVWHRDHEDVRIAKAFLYLSDVHDTGAGPLIYAPGTHTLGVHAGQEAPIYHEPDSGLRRSTDADVAAIVPEAEWITVLGPTGTLVLADTAGYHKGGHATTTSRLLATWEWTTAHAREASRFNPFGARR